MEGVPLSLAVVVLVALTCGGGPVHTLAQDCPTPNFTLKDGDKQLIKESHHKGRFNYMSMFVKAQQGFQGIFVNVTGLDGMPYGAWFPADPQCFPPDDEWYWLSVSTGTEKNTLLLYFWINDCYKKCIKNYNQGSFQSLSVKAYGPSIWLLERPPDPCHFIDSNMPARPTTLPSCDSTPPQAPTTPPITTTTPANGTGQSCASETASSAGTTWKVMLVMAATVAVVVVVAVTVALVVLVAHLRQN